MEGNWLLKYLIDRINHTKFRSSLENLSNPLFDMPRAFRPRFHLKFISKISDLLFSAILHRLPEWMSSSRFIRRAAVGAVAVYGRVKGAYWPIANAENIGSLSAGLPHFAEGIWRCWGRDTLIAMRGTLLLTNRVAEATAAVLAFGGAVRHGLVPNLLGEGKVSRYNCRDATWFWLHAVKDLDSHGVNILEMKIKAGFKTDDAEFDAENAKEIAIRDFVQYILQRHIDGIDFTERNAGEEIDRNMDQRGFAVKTRIDLKTGFPTGGNKWNCGTWMDKMGESEMGKNRGVPSTPRDGAPVEIVGLCFAVVAWLARVSQAKPGETHISYPHIGVTLPSGEILTWANWAHLIRRNFDKKFWIEPCGYYGDTYGSSVPGADSQFRCNFSIALAVAPKITNPSNAIRALKTVDETLISGLGLRTLDPDDVNYRPNYFSDDALDPKIAKGANYHNGPSWVWPLGYHLLARLNFDQSEGIEKLLAGHCDHLFTSDWMGLPELQNDRGSHCPGSCPIQAWSHATLIEVAHKMYNKF